MAPRDRPPPEQATGVRRQSALPSVLRGNTRKSPISRRQGGVRLERAAKLIRTAGDHAERAYSVAQGAAPLPEVEELANSWQRSTNRYGVDPVDSRAPRILTAGEVKDSREPLGNLISTA